jgi:uncharacterized phage-associated protein
MPKSSIKIDREDLLLILLLAMSERSERVGSITRLEKMMFLLQKETDVPKKLQAAKFDFKAWKFGPFSKEVYEALDLLSSLRLVDIEEKELAGYVEFTERDELVAAEENEPVIEKVFSLTDRGRKVAEKLKALLSEDEWNKVVQLNRRFESVPLTSLIQYVYRKYPETTEKSVLEHLKPR